MMKSTKINLELLTDIDMVYFIQNGIRGGLAQCSKRYSKANNKYMKEYNIDEEDRYIVYLDANNLYGWSMLQPLPYADFRWLNNAEVSQMNINNLNDYSEKGYIFKVDLEYPEALHKWHNDIPFCVEKMKPLYYNSKETKLLASFTPKTKYVIHQKNLKQCLREGLKLTKIHRILEFSQKPWLKSYIDMNTNLRMQASNSFEKDFYKLLNNCIFGKCIEDVDKRVDVRLITHWDSIKNKIGANTLISRPNFQSCSIFTENLVAIQLKRVKVTYNKPIYIGFCVLDISKTLLYDFHYQYMKPKYQNDLALLYTDTDSLIYEIKTNDFYDDIKSDLKESFGTSDYPMPNRYNLPIVNKKVVGKFKDETAGKLVLEFIGLKAKMYCLTIENDIEIKKIKGIKKNVVQNEVSTQNFKDCLKNNETIFRKQQTFRSSNHNLYTQLINKLTLNNFDDKRFVIPNSYETLAWSSKSIDDFYFI